jgi:signal transduction histidine kinase
MESTARISDLVHAVKSFTYMDQAPVQEVNLHEGIEVTLSLLHHKMGNVRIERQYDPELPVLHTHGGELNQVWMNILDNALDALKGSGTITIRTSHDRTGVCVEISDDGPGIPGEIQQRIFDPFSATKEVGEGTGLGLDVACRTITRSHGGEVRVESEPGRTTFQVWLPTGT